MGWSQNRQCGNDNRRGNYRHQNYGRNDSRDREDKILEVSLMIREVEAQHQEEMVTEGTVVQT